MVLSIGFSIREQLREWGLRGVTVDQRKGKRGARRLGKVASILLAEDEPSVLFTFRAVLEESGYEVLPVDTFSAARKTMQEKEFDAVVAAVGLEQDGRGLELARAAKDLSLPPAVLLYSGDPSVEKLRAAMSARVDYFAFQSIDLEEIKSALYRLVAHRLDFSCLG